MIGFDDRYRAGRALFRIPSFQFVMAPHQTVARPKPYVSIRELSELTPWTDQAIRTMISKGVLREGEHFFHVGRRPVFKWEAIVRFIEHQEMQPQSGIPLHRGGFINGAS